MAKPRVFISSAYVGLSDLRKTLGTFFEDEGYEPILFEAGGVFFDHSAAIDESCYEAVKDCDIFVLIVGGRYGSKSSRDIKVNRAKKYNSVTRTEYLTARDAGLPIFTFVDAAVMSEMSTWRNNRHAKKAPRYAHVDTPQIFELINEIFHLSRNNFVQQYTTSADIVSNLRNQIAGIVLKYAKARRAKSMSKAEVRVNPYKLFFFRYQRGMSYNQLADITGIETKRLRQMEDVNKSAGILELNGFRSCEKEEAEKLEAALGCTIPITAGRPDDFLSAYMLYYATYKRKSFIPVARRTEEVYPTKAVVFDFDGTLTTSSDDETTWEKIWKLLGYSINDCAFYHRMYSEGKLSHPKWCELTCDKFYDRGLSEAQLLEVAQSIKLIPGTSGVLKKLASQNVKLYILSGSIKRIIKEVLGEDALLFEDIRANELVFGKDGTLKKIVGTSYDFEGKADYLRRVIVENRLDPLEVLFVGNSCNDVFASRSGARTLCVNPRFTDPDNVEQWTYALRRMEDFEHVLRYAMPSTVASARPDRDGSVGARRRV